jgi:membrane fusion protein (multidrug efflux system)
MPATQRHALRRILAASCLAALSVLASCGKSQTASAPKPPPVGTITVRYQLVKRTTDLPGRTEAVTISDIRPQVSGVILSRLFTEGSDVKAGQQLYQIDPAPYQATLDSAIASLKHDQAQLITDRLQAARFKPLAAAQAVSEQDYDNAVAAVQEDEANVASAQATIESARINLQYTQMYSPISGTIGASSVTPGALVTADQTTVLATVTQLDPLYVDVNEPTVTWLRLKEEVESGQLQTNPDGTAKVTLTMEDGSTYKLSGELQFSEVNVDQTTGTVLVRAIFPNPDHLLLPGMYVHAEVDEGGNKNGILVPQQAVSHNQHGDATVMLINDKNVVSQQVIDTSTNVGTYWAVTGGLKPGDRVIVDGVLNATAGKTVTPTDETANYTYNAS